MLSPAMVNAFFSILSGLSPENLMADGERSRTAAARVKRALKAQWKRLEAEVGRRVTEEEVWAEWSAMRYRALPTERKAEIKATALYAMTIGS